MSMGKDDTRAQLMTFLGLTFGLSAVLYTLIIRAGSLGAGGGMYVLALMWSPGVSALITRLVFQRNLRGQGWGLGSPKWLALSLSLNGPMNRWPESRSPMIRRYKMISPF